MSDSELSKEIQDFINSHIRSVGNLDVLFLLSSDPTKIWTAEDVSRELRTNSNYATSQLQELKRIGLIDTIGGGFSSRKDPQILDIVYKTRNAYNLRRSSVINLIYDQPLEKIRDFAEAFKLKKD